jgi:hypothetical protein
VTFRPPAPEYDWRVLSRSGTLHRFPGLHLFREPVRARILFRASCGVASTASMLTMPHGNERVCVSCTRNQLRGAHGGSGHGAGG